MKEKAIEFINIIENNGYKAYIVGGFVRDYLLGIESTDIDITTNATPKIIKTIFDNIKSKRGIDESSYGSIIVNYKNVIFEVTTFTISKLLRFSFIAFKVAVEVVTGDTL